MNNLSIEDLKNISLEFFKSNCIMANHIFNLNEIESMSSESYRDLIINLIPQKLYRYYSNKEIDGAKGETNNYSLYALFNNTVYLNTPTKYDDYFDSCYKLSFEQFSRYYIKLYLDNREIKYDSNLPTNELSYILQKDIRDYCINNSTFENYFHIKNQSEIICLQLKYFVLELEKHYYESMDLNSVLTTILKEMFIRFCGEMKTILRSTCFTTNPLSPQMWALYADNNRGFCLEYDINCTDETKSLYVSLFPVIYSLSRNDYTEKACAFMNNLNSDDKLYSLLKNGTLRKNIEWCMQDEWRLVLVFPKDQTNFNKPFFKISKVYLGPKMKKENRKQIIDYCNQNKIEYVDVFGDYTEFKMYECNNKCEFCPKFLNEN